MKQLLRIATILLVTFGWSASAQGYRDPCYTQARNYDAALRNLANTNNMLLRQQEQLQRMQDASMQRQADLYYQILDARAYLDWVNSTNGGNTAACAVRFIFWGGFNGCFIGAVRANNARRDAAEYRIRQAELRYQQYIIVSAGQLQRQAARVVDAQNRFNQAQVLVQNAQTTLNACIAANPAPAG